VYLHCFAHLLFGFAKNFSEADGLQNKNDRNPQFTYSVKNTSFIGLFDKRSSISSLSSFIASSIILFFKSSPSLIKRSSF
jgi:hypothetical protein